MNPISKLNNFELHSLSRLFDDGDVAGDNCLTRTALETLVLSVGGLNEILNELDWLEEGINKTPIFSSILSDIQSKYQDAIDLDQFIVLMMRFMPSSF